MLCSYGNQVEISLSSCGHTCTDFAIGNRKEELKNLLRCGKFSFYVMVDSEVFPYLENKRLLILEPNKKLKIFDF